MAFTFDKQLEAATEQTMRDFFATLSEKEQRRFAALEARQLGYGGVKYVAEGLACSRRTIERGLAELADLPHDPAAGRVRRPGGGRKKRVRPPALELNLPAVLQTRTGGDPEDATRVFTDLSPAPLAELLGTLGTPVSDETIRQWMDAQGRRRRKIRKVLPGGASADREAQFGRIAELIDEYRANGNPYFSIDTKAKEHVGKLYRAGRSRCSHPFQAFDHDFPSWADGVIIPHGIDDPRRNRGPTNSGVSHDTSEFARDSLLWYWNRIGKQCHPKATSILLLCDCGGSNAANKYMFTHDLQRLATRIGLESRVAHYPSYCSKYNPIERRLFAHISRACAGLLLDTLETAVALMRKTTTRTGLKTTVNVIRRLDQTGRNATPQIKRNLQIFFDNFFPKWNYRAIPQYATIID